MDYDMTEDLNAILPILSRTQPANVASLAPPTDDMLIHQAPALPASSAASVGAACALSNDAQGNQAEGIQRNADARPSNSGYPASSALRRSQESVDCDMPDRLNADSDLSTPSRPHTLNLSAPADVGIISPDTRHV